MNDNLKEESGKLASEYADNMDKFPPVNLRQERREAFIKGIESALTSPIVQKHYRDKFEKEAWVSVEERMPRIGSEVLVYPSKWKYDTLVAQVRVYNGGNWKPQFEDGSLKGITHWRELPSPPALFSSQNSKG